MKRYNGSLKDLRLAKTLRIKHMHGSPKDKLISFLTEEHHKLVENEITDNQFRENVKLILR